MPSSVPEASAAAKGRRGIQSVEIGSGLLLELARQMRPLALKDLARAARMTTSKAHPYMVSFLKVGFVTQTEAGHYELGPLALHLGLARLRRMDPVKEASAVIEDLAAQTGHSVAIVIWGNLGPTIVRMEEPIEPLHVNLRAGTVMALSNTATGRLFAAYMPRKVIDHFLLHERDRFIHGAERYEPMGLEHFESLLQETRSHGLSRTLGHPIPGIDAFCAPVFDPDGHLVLGLLVMGASATFDNAWDGEVATALKQAASDVAQRIGGAGFVPD
ncbi:MAG TPA: IclR family transcriptional regulator [Castellaniella sp.]|nr:IclR family transcriptional regulator [Castellaniella sp.]